MEEQNLIKQMSLPLFQSRAWMKLVGVFLFIYGVMMVFTIVGIVICWLPIWLGVLLFKAAGHAEGAQLNGDSRQLVAALERIKTFFLINGVLLLAMLIMIAISIIITGGAVFSILNQYG